MIDSLRAPTPSRLLVGLMLVAGVATGVLIVFNLSAMLVVVAATWILVLLWLAGPTARVTLPLALLLIVPADNIVQLTGPLKGFFALGVALLLFIGALLRGRFRFFSARDWDVHLLCAVSLGGVAIHAGSGSLRVAVYWAAAVLLFAWLRAEGATDSSVRNATLRAVTLAGVITSAVALMEQFGQMDVTTIFASYEPDRSQFTSWLGLRAVGASGHALRLGTLAMLAVVVSLASTLDPQRRFASRLTSIAVTVICGAALILSGARGAWLGVLIGGAAVIAHQYRLKWSHTLTRLIAVAALAGIFLWASGLGVLVFERVAGDAVAPYSLNQRLEAMRTIMDTAASIPLFGAGYGGVDDILYRGGLIVPNIENEYLLSLVALGPIGPLVLIALGYRRGRHSWDHKHSLEAAAAFGCVVSLWLNLATYNLFSSSIGAALLCVVAYTAWERQPPLAAAHDKRLPP